MAGLVAALKEQPNIRIESNATAVDLITFPHHSRDPLDNYRPISCHGCYVFDRDEKTVHRYLAQATVLATGGLGRIYRSTTNPIGARGDGLAMAIALVRASQTPSTCSFIRRRWRRREPRGC